MKFRMTSLLTPGLRHRLVGVDSVYAAIRGAPHPHCFFGGGAELNRSVAGPLLLLYPVVHCSFSQLSDWMFISNANSLLFSNKQGMNQNEYRFSIQTMESTTLQYLFLLGITPRPSSVPSAVTRRACHHSSSLAFMT